MLTDRTAYRLGLVIALGAGLFLLWGVAAMGIVGAEGDAFDLLYLGVLAVGAAGAIVVRLRPAELVRVLTAMAVAIGAITVLALVLGKHQSPVSSVAEIVGLNGLFVLLFLGAARLVRQAADRPAAT